MAAATQVEVGLRRLFDKNEPELVAQWGHWNWWGTLTAKSLWALIEQPNKCAKL